MVWVVGVFCLFSMLVILLVSYHFYVWDNTMCKCKGVRSWVSSFECGFLSQRFSEKYFSCSFFVLLVFFVVFDLEISLVLNLPFQGVLYKNFMGYMIFIGCLVSGYLYEVESGYISWGV